MSPLLLTAVVLTVSLVLHALPGLGGHAGAATAHSVSHSLDTEHDCDTAPAPHRSKHPHCLATPRVGDSGGQPLAALPLLALARIDAAGRGWQARVPGGPPAVSRSGQQVLHALCVSRR